MERASKAAAAMGADMAVRSVRCRPWVSRSVSLSGLAGGGEAAGVAARSRMACRPSSGGRLVPGPRPCRASARPRLARGSSRTRLLSPPRTLRLQRDESGNYEADEDGTDRVQYASVEPHHRHSRRREMGGPTELRVVRRRRHFASAVRSTM